MQTLQDQRDALILSGQQTQEAYDAQREDIQAQLDFISQGAEQRQLEVDKLQKTNELLQKEIELADPFLITQDELKTKAEKLRDEFNLLIEPVAALRSVLEGLMLEQAKIAADQKEAIDPETYIGSYGGARAAGGRVYPNKWYMVGEHGPEPFVPDSTGTILPNRGGTTHNNRKVINLAPISIYPNSGSAEDALDFLFKKM